VERGSAGRRGGRRALPESVPPAALTIAGSDSGGGAGIQADLKTFQALGVFGMSVVTAVTAQNTRAVTGVWDLPVEAVRAQIAAVFDDLPVAAVKTGMLSSVGLVEAVADELAARVSRRRPGRPGASRGGAPPLVVDPVMVAKSGARLLADDAVAAVAGRLLPLATVVTPNLEEASVLLGRRVEGLDEAERAARDLLELGPGAALVKGGHASGAEAIDVLWDGRTLTRFRAAREVTRHTHGTGCTLSAALAAQLARGRDLPEAVARAKRYVTLAIAHALPLGGGHGPTHHFWFLEGDPTDPPATGEDPVTVDVAGARAEARR